MDGKKRKVTHFPKKTAYGYQYMRSLCGNNSVSSASSLELVTCSKCLNILMSRRMKTDFENLEDGRCVTLHPNESNPLHNGPERATYSNGYFYCHSSDPVNGPDYYLGDVLAYNKGYTD